MAADANDLSGLLSKNHNRGKVRLVCSQLCALDFVLTVSSLLVQLKENAKNGISAAMRPSAWQVMAMTAEFTKRYPQLYEVRGRMHSHDCSYSFPCHFFLQLLLQQGRSMEYDSVIVVDVSRAIPTVPFFGTSEAPGWVLSLQFLLLLSGCES